MLTEGHSTLDTEQVIISQTPFACTWLWREDRTDRVRLVANTNYWDAARGPHLSEVLFRNDLAPQQALELVCTTEGEVDIVTEVAPADASRVEQSEHAKLVTIDALRMVAGIINRDAAGLPLADQRARQALNFAIDREKLVKEAMFGHASPLAGLTPPAAVTFLHRLSPYAHDKKRAAALWQAAGGINSRPLRLAAPDKFERVAQQIALDLQEALSITVEVTIYRALEEKLANRRHLAEKQSPPAWDILIQEHGPQEADGPPLELHRAFVGANGEYRAGPVIPAFEQQYAEFVAETAQMKLAQIAYQIDKFVYDEALALFLCAPQALYGVNKQVDFTAYRTTFELAECKVSEKHWSRRS